jgi:hypothetical protein
MNGADLRIVKAACCHSLPSLFRQVQAQVPMAIAPFSILFITGILESIRAIEPDDVSRPTKSGDSAHIGGGERTEDLMAGIPHPRRRGKDQLRTY